ncbi:MAG TPA: N-6 DNA methylase [Aldersonia sp.]
MSNWRRRYPEFPKPVGGSPNSPTFRRADVESWLTATGKANQLATAGRTDTGSQRVDEPVPERAVTELTSGELLARVMVALLPRATATGRDLDTPVVLDPACAEATLLMAVADRFSDRVTLVGQDVNEQSTAAAASNLRQRPDSVAYEIHTGDSLLDNRLGRYLRAAAAVVCEPPFDVPEWPSEELTTDPRWRFGVPAPRDGELAWMQHCYAHLRPGGVAVVAVSPRTCVQPSGQRIRAELVRSGALRDVIALPPRMGSLPGTDVYLWVLQRPSGAMSHSSVRFVDLTGLHDAADVPHEFGAWQQLFDDADPTICRVVPSVKLLDRGTSLLPADHVSRVEASADDIALVVRRLQALYASIGRGLPRFAAPVRPPRYSYVTIAELERTGALTIRTRDTTPRAGDVLLRTLGRPPAVATGTDADDVGVAQVVEIDATRLDADFVATFLRGDANALPTANTLGAVSRDDLRRCRVPRMPLAEQRLYGNAFRHLHELQFVLSALANVGVNVIDQIVHGLTVGALAPEDEMRNL